MAIQPGGGRWVAPLFLLIGVLAPTVCVLWFMNVAVNNQRDASRRKLAEAYGGQLALLRDRVDAYWALRASDLERETREGAAPVIFERVVKLGLADSAVMLGRAAYPSAAGAIEADPAAGRADWMAARMLENWREAHAAAESWAAIARAERDPALAARAAQARIRCLARSGDKAATLRAMEEEFGGGRRGQATDLTGRVIAADEFLLAIHLMPAGDARRATYQRRVAEMVNDYAATAMPAAQRVYLMEELISGPTRGEPNENVSSPQRRRDHRESAETDGDANGRPAESEKSGQFRERSSDTDGAMSAAFPSQAEPRPPGSGFTSSGIDPATSASNRAVAGHGDRQDPKKPATVAAAATQRIGAREDTDGTLAAAFPTLAAERIAAQFLETGRTQAGEAALEASGVADLWKLTVGGGRAIALYRTSTVLGAMRSLASDRGLALAVTPPGGALPKGGESLPAGSRLPGWQVSLVPAADRAVDELARRQTASYIWIGMLAIAVVAITALVAGGAVRRQWQAARLKTDLAAAVSHELRTPLASMRLLVDTLLDDEAPDPGKSREYLELIARENARLSRLMENFLTFSRLERNRQRFEFHPTPPERLVRGVVDAVGDRFAVQADVAPGMRPVRADPDALTTVLLNLLDNAYKYSPGEKRIVLRAFERNGRVVFTVQDHGIGIAPRERKRIFRRFYQVDQRLAREAGGCGLGLSIVEYIVRAHGGTVRVESEPGKGSTFSVELP